MLFSQSLVFRSYRSRVPQVPLRVEGGERGVLLPQLCKPCFGLFDIDIIDEIEC
jgi:hypothetical protein